MPERDIIIIDEEKCDGCGQCVTACAEGAIQLVDGKARLISELYCDGLGACIGECPTGALIIERRQAEAFDEIAVEEHLASQDSNASVCPGQAQQQIQRGGSKESHAADPTVPSELTHWPIQLKLARPDAPQFRGADVLIAADCTAFALGDFHRRLLAGRGLLIACPKLDDPSGYIEKVAALFRDAQPRSVTVARMEVPCCRGLVELVKKGREEAGSDLPVLEIIVGIEGEILSENTITAEETTTNRNN